MRPYQWYKNLVLFAGVTFAGQLMNSSLFSKAVVAFGIFCLLSGAGYMINDITDRASDSHHSEKSRRPIASGNISGSHALVISALIFFIGNCSAFFLTVEFGVCAVSYSLVTVLYSVLLKRVVLLDVITISIGFVIRAVAGAVAIDVYISPWLVLCAFMLALFLGLCKRKQEQSLLYEPQFLNHLVSITTTLVIMSYSLYTFLRATQEMMITIPLVLYGLFRFLKLSYDDQAAKPAFFFLDGPLMITFVLWVLLVVFLLYVI
jgi:4-hydroxybenzoate polyprenyltransferase